jgi:hypothetical protein
MDNILLDNINITISFSAGKLESFFSRILVNTILVNTISVEKLIFLSEGHEVYPHLGALGRRRRNTKLVNA